MRIIGMIVVAIAALGLLIFIAMDGRTDAPTYATYTNERYLYEIDYPTFFTPQGESQNGDGQVFTDGDSTLRVFGIQNTDNDTLRVIADTYLEAGGTEVTVIDDSADRVTLRTMRGDVVRLVTVIPLPDDRVGVATLEYAQDAIDDDVANTIVQSFHSTASTAGNETQNGTDIDDETGDGSGSVPVGYRLYQNAQLEFSMLVPREATTNMVGSNRTEITFFGPDNEPGTEITDGFHVTVFQDDLEQTYDSTLVYAQSVFDETESGSENSITASLESRTVNGQQAYRYAYTGALGTEITEYVFLGEDSEVGFRVSYSVQDPNAEGYESVVLTMLESFRFQSGMTEGPPVFEMVQLAMLDREGTSAGEERGCDRVVMVSASIEPTTAPLTAALERLFAINDETYNNWHHFIARTNDTLSFERATVEDGVASIYLSGELSGLAGVCDNPRARIQIEETALQFETVDEVQLYLDGELTDLTPDGQGS